MVTASPRGINPSGGSFTNFGGWAFAALLLFPYFVVCFHFRELPPLDWQEFFWSLRLTILQAAGSAFVATAFGLLMGCGLWMMQSEVFRKWGQFLLVIPSFLPSLFVILLFFEILPLPQLGLPAIILVQGFIYSGFFAAVWYFWLEEQGSKMIETALVLGAGPYEILLLVVRTHSRSILRTSFLILTICFSAFAIPLALGGGHGTTIEVLIFEKIRSVVDRPQALSLSLLQSLLIGMLSLSLRPLHRRPGVIGGEFRKAFPWALQVLPIFYVALIAWGLVKLGLDAWGQSLDFDWWPFAWHSLALGILAGVFFMVWSLWFVAIWSPTISRLLRGYTAPSLTLMGLALILWQPESQFLQMICYTGALVLLVGPSLLRSGPEPLRESLLGQCEVATMMGASRWVILWQVLWPQMKRNLSLTAGLACLWMMGEFALAKVFLSQDLTLAQIIFGLVNAYRLNQAALAMLGLLALSGLGFLAFWGIGYVRRTES